LSVFLSETFLVAGDKREVLFKAEKVGLEGLYVELFAFAMSS
jgi:hypothetical protein